MVRLICAAGTLWLVACATDRLEELEPQVTACVAGTTTCGAELALGAFRAGVSHVGAIDVRNLGSGALVVRDASVLEGDLAIASTPAEIEPELAAALSFSFTPVLGRNHGRLRISSNDPETPHLDVALTFDGVAPALVLCPVTPAPADPTCVDNLTIELGEVRPTQALDVTVLVRNAGTEDLPLAGATMSDGSSVAGELEILTSTAAGLLGAGSDSPMVVRYRPLDGLGDVVVITVAPEDDTVPAVTLTLNGTAPVNLAPEATAHEHTTLLTAIDGVVDGGLWLDGSTSFDPEGDPLQYSWSVVARPAGSSAVPETSQAALTRFVPDVLGTYIVQLTVTDSLSLVDFADVTVEAAPRDALRFELSWGDDAGDVDLHVVPEGAALFSALDCHFGRTSVELGIAGDSRDDAVLVADSEAGDGAERVVIRRPADGRYELWAHYFDSRGDRLAEVRATVSRDDGSSVLGSAEDTLGTTCEAWMIGVVDWPLAVFTPASAPHELSCPAGAP